jgi:MFS transporter, FHS family, L-fucose permease
MGIAGGAVIPLVYTNLRDTAHLSNSLSFFTCMLPGYVYIFYYAVKGFRVGKPLALTVA